MDVKDSEELCIQFPNFSGFQLFHLSVVGSDFNGKCQAEVKELDLFSSFQLHLVEPNQKKIGDTNFAEFGEEEFKRASYRESFEKYHLSFEFMRKDAKALSHKLLEFADTNQKELKGDFLSSLSK